MMRYPYILHISFTISKVSLSSIYHGESSSPRNYVAFLMVILRNLNARGCMSMLSKTIQGIASLRMHCFNDLPSSQSGSITRVDIRVKLNV
jgi:hypothetical protein